jgi:hypothetical protein
VIPAPFTYNDDEMALVDAFLDRPAATMVGTYWSDDSLVDLKQRAKSYYIEIQCFRCCYCNQLIQSTNHRLWDLEHVVPRTSHPRFMFEPINLAAACPDCNGAKAASQPLILKDRRKYPCRSDAFTILHPHFDEFDDHLYWNGSLIYEPRTLKGKETIYVCDLLRFVQRHLTLPANPLDRRFEQSVADLQSLDSARSKQASADIAAITTASAASDQPGQ